MNSLKTLTACLTVFLVEATVSASARKLFEEEPFAIVDYQLLKDKMTGFISFISRISGIRGRSCIILIYSYFGTIFDNKRRHSDEWFMAFVGNYSCFRASDVLLKTL